MYNLSGKVALVTGAASKLGIGRACAVRLAEEGADVVVIDIADATQTGKETEPGWQGLDSVVREIKARGRQGLAVYADVASSRDVQEMVSRSLDRFGKIDILVSNAGIGGMRLPVSEMSEEGWNRSIAVNLTGAFLCCKAVSRNMVERGQGGKIIVIASINGKIAWAERSDYCASKFGVIGFTQSLAGELARHSINVNAVCPGPAETNIHVGWMAREAKRRGISTEQVYRQYYESFVPQIPWGRSATAEDIAKVVAFLASAEAEYITGQAINVDGGMVMAR